MDRTQALTGGLLVAAMVLVPGLTKYVLTQAGYGLLGTIVWYGGYALGVVLIWLLWIRPLDITGPGEPNHPEE